MLHKTMVRGFLAAALVASAVTAQADVFNLGGTISGGTWTGLASLSFVTVGNPGNVADLSTGYGAVPYTYQMGTYDVTTGQYVAFLNSVATQSDTYGLYNSNMALSASFRTIGIKQTSIVGVPGISYSYSVTGSDPQAANCPVFDVTWLDAARFCNWLQNGQLTGSEGTATTEAGAYTLNGDTTSGTESRNANAKYVIPSENEFYKAAYYSGGGTNSAYYTYPTKSNIAPDNSLVLAPTDANDANYYISGCTDPTNYLTPVGTFVASAGPYGTYDMGGDVWQWNEAGFSGSYRGLRGGSLEYNSFYMASSLRASDSLTDEYYGPVGFRVASVPEPGSLALLFAGAVAFGIWRLRRKA